MLPEKLLRQMQEPTVETPGSALGDAVGISWMLRDVDGVRIVGHGGDTIGQHSSFDMVPERDFAIAGLTNCGPNGNQFLEELGRWAFETYLGVVERDPEPVVLGDDELADYAGPYETVAATATITVDSDRGGLVLDRRDQARDAGEADARRARSRRRTRRSRSASCPDRATATSSPTARPRA